jgi:hypothetical protein
VNVIVQAIVLNFYWSNFAKQCFHRNKNPFDMSFLPLVFQSGCKDTLTIFKLPNLFKRFFEVFFSALCFQSSAFLKPFLSTASLIQKLPVS